MDINYIEYKRENNRIGKVMLLLLAATFAVPFGLLSIELFKIFFESDKAYAVFYELSYSLMYFCMFFIPMLMYKLFDRSYSFSQMPCKIKLSKHFPLILLAGLGINFLAASLNSLIVTLMGVDTSSLTSSPFAEGYSGYNFILDVIKIAIIPAFCEELLFRGLILDRLSKFGRLKAIIISSLLFSLMHQHPAQLIYTFILGMFLGYMALESGSIWGGILLHFINNLIQVIMNAVLYTQSEARATFIVSIIQLVIILVGAVAAVIYFKNYGWGKITNDEWLSYPTETAPQKGAVSGFFSPAIIIYCVISILVIGASF